MYLLQKGNYQTTEIMHPTVFICNAPYLSTYLYETRGVVVAIAENMAANVKIVVIPMVTLPGT